jgi:hypothetical protein
MSEVNKVNEKLSSQELIERYAKLYDISIEQAKQEIDAPTEEEILENINKRTIEYIRSKQPPMNRAQRRALKKRMGAKKYAQVQAENGDVISAVTDTAAKLSYIDLIQKLRKLNEEKEKNGETTIEDD